MAVLAGHARGGHLCTSQELWDPWPWSGLTKSESRNTLKAMDYARFITIEPGKMGGKPCVRGLRITVYDVLDYLASGMSEVELLRDFPDLTSDDIRACLAFAADRERKLLVLSE